MCVGRSYNPHAMAARRSHTNPIRRIADFAGRRRLRVAGLMSGTSADGVDVAVVDISESGVHVAAFDTVPYPAAVRRRIFQLFDPSTARLDEICRFNFLLGELYADALIAVCRRSRVPLSSIDLIGSHGQTIQHLPERARIGGRAVSSTLQIGEPSVIAQRMGITTVADFRPRDMAAGGQGAPLVPYADYVLFRHRTRSRIVQNIGGIANLTWLPARCRVGDVVAFDTGPGNMVIDAVVSLLTGGRRHFDKDGAMAAGGKVCSALLTECLRHPFFARRPPKSTGREEFGLPYARRFLAAARKKGLEPADIVATATALTATTIADAYRRFLPRLPDEVVLAGGGARNRALVAMLRSGLEGIHIRLSDELGVNADAREAVSFAILAYATVKGLPGNVPSATGASEPVVLGKIVPA